MEEDGQSFVVASFPKNTREVICMGTNEWKGKNLLFVRTFARAVEGDDLVPTREGISLSVEKYAELLEGVKALETLSEDGITAKIQKNKTQQIWVGRNTYKNTPLLFIRTYMRFGEDPELKPTKQGISINADLFQNLLDGVEKLSSAIVASEGK